MKMGPTGPIFLLLVPDATLLRYRPWRSGRRHQTAFPSGAASTTDKGKWQAT
jgi:hypothetical protein